MMYNINILSPTDWNPMTSVQTEQSLHIRTADLASQFASKTTSETVLVSVNELFDSELLSLEHRLELAELVNKRFALPQNHQPYYVVYVHEIEAFLGLDKRRLKQSLRGL